MCPLDADEVRAREPGLAADLQGGVLVAGEAVIDPWSAPLAYVSQGVANGGLLLRGTEVTGGTLHDGIWQLVTGRPGVSVAARVVINCAGNYGDLVEAIARPSPFAIRPRKGQFVVYDKPAHALVESIVLPVPNERTKGVVVTRALGNRRGARSSGIARFCHCEMVTRDEIKAAFAQPLPAGSLGGLKRRTRCMMGRCQASTARAA